VSVAPVLVNAQHRFIELRNSDECGQIDICSCSPILDEHCTFVIWILCHALGLIPFNEIKEDFLGSVTVPGHGGGL
jgi:hypothetical protein